MLKDESAGRELRYRTLSKYVLMCIATYSQMLRSQVNVAVGGGIQLNTNPVNLKLELLYKLDNFFPKINLYIK